MCFIISSNDFNDILYFDNYNAFDKLFLNIQLS
jgi:hypothetical protein